MGEAESKFNIIDTENKTYDISKTEEAIDFLVYALNGKFHGFFIDFLFSHIGINILKYSYSFFELKKSKSIYEIEKDTYPFFDYILEDFYENNIFYKYIYYSNETDLLKKQKISKLVEGLKKTLNRYFDFHSVIIYWNLEIDKEYKLIKEYSITNDFCVNYTYYCICKILINYYDYLHNEFYIFIDDKNKFDINYSNKIKDSLKDKKLESKKITLEKQDYIWKNIFIEEEIFIKFKNLYEEKNIINPYNDFSFLYYELLANNKIKKISHKIFYTWLFENNFMNNKDFGIFEEKASLNKKAKSEYRLNFYNKYFK